MIFVFEASKNFSQIAHFFVDFQSHVSCIILLVSYMYFSILNCILYVWKRKLDKAGKKERYSLLSSQIYRKRVKNGKLFDSSQIKYCHRAFCKCVRSRILGEMYVVCGNNVCFLRFSSQFLILHLPFWSCLMYWNRNSTQ